MEKAAREQAQAAFTMAEADFKREEQLFRQGPAAAQEYERARSTRRSAARASWMAQG
jgi:multidrug resistance efflux pump